MTPDSPERAEDLIEKLAAIEHERWSGWHNHARSSWTKENIARWDRQADTHYSALSEREKESDRKEVRRYWPLIESALLKAREEGYEKGLRDAEKAARNFQLDDEVSRAIFALSAYHQSEAETKERT